MKISIILPFYKKLSQFKFVCRHTPAFRHKDIELVIPMDDPAGELELVKFVKENGIKARIIVNDRPHSWRPPCKAINVGLRHALGSWVIVQSPESLLFANPQRLINHTKRRLNRFIVGRLYHGKTTDYPKHNNWFMFKSFTPGYGFIMVEKLVLVALHGFDERREGYGGDDDDIRLRLKQLNFICTIDPKIRIVHLRHGTNRRPPRIDFEPYGHDIIIPNQTSWGLDFNRIAYDYTA